MAEAERIRNDRPIMRVSNDPKDPPALTPNRLLLMRSNACLPRVMFKKEDSYSLKSKSITKNHSIIFDLERLKDPEIAEALKKKYEPCDDMSVFMKKILQSENMYTYLSSADRVENQCILRRVGRFIIDSINIDQENPYGQGSVTNDVDIKKTENALHLFIYAILFESEEKAQTRLSDCDDPIGAALIASSLLKTISKLANRDAELDLATNVLKNAREYEQKACDMLSTYFHRNRTGAYTFLIHKFHEPFSSINALELANANHLKNFMAHTCCQTKLNAVWRGKMATYTPWWQIVIALFLPIFVKTIKFTPEKSQDAGDSFGTFDDLYHLYTAPISVFATNTISFLIFVGLCSYFVLVELEVRVTLLEYVIWGWALTLLFEEFRQLISSDGSIARKLRYWFASYWNQYDLAMFIVGVAAIIVRLTVNGDDEFDSVRYLYSITVAMFYVRSLQSFLVEENLGPKIIMLGKMIIDLIVFVRVFLIFVLSFGIMYTANLFPNSRLSLQLLKRIFYVPYWQIYGENFLEFLEGDDNGCTRNESVWRDTGDMRCPESNVLVPVLGGLYMFLTNILLINLLIAMFR
ncbi:transient receptor potential cation channel subfamily M member-like 2 [Dreissena polymorpha]|uniref:transient receptor potential cation channel subfamily M member-like 2 n=1 Tax=Dreissena polymorpha TaxID=45954 RepID=UPI002264C981|nr:transient receptor potential cation channel subfamily M member-like 2 [Dreissena polymorpha]